MNLEKLKNLFTKPNKKQLLFIAISFLIIGLLVFAVLMLLPTREPMPVLPEQEVILEPRTIEEIKKDLTAPERKEPLTEKEIQKQQQELERILETLTAPE